MIATTRETFNLHPGGMIFGAEITLDRVLEVERLPQALSHAIERWLLPDQTAASTVGESLKRDAPARFWEWQTVLTAHDIGIYVSISEKSESIWVNSEMYWHDAQFAGSQIEAIFVPDLAENQALTSATEGDSLSKIVAIFLSSDPHRRIDVAYGIMTTPASRLHEIDLEYLRGHDLDEQVVFDSSNSELLYTAYQKCQKELTGNG